MKSKRFITASVLLVTTMTGCATFSETAHPTAEGMQQRTADELGYKKAQVKVSNLHENGTMTYWVADTPKGRYACSMDSGVWVAVNSMGSTISITCKK